MEIYVRYLHNYMIKLSDNGRLEIVLYSVAHKNLISDTALRFLIPPQVRKMTPRLLQIRGCDIFIIHKDIQINLNIFRTKVVSYLQHESVGRNTGNSAYSTTSAAHYKYKVFLDGEFLYATN